ncbi:MAG: hypothetical protein M0C28_22140 [Candidatus Moduliflexus flocculans]|nr:hypothetical protein [Candidatus Moduliflexus flocculans]
MTAYPALPEQAHQEPRGPSPVVPAHQPDQDRHQPDSRGIHPLWICQDGSCRLQGRGTGQDRALAREYGLRLHLCRRQHHTCHLPSAPGAHRAAQRPPGYQGPCDRPGTRDSVIHMVL